MKKTITSLVLIITLAFAGLIFKVMAAQDVLVLARVVYTSLESIIDLPIYALFQDEQGQDYALVLAHSSQLKERGVGYEILDSDAEGANYWLIRPRQSVAGSPASARWLYFDGQRGIIRIDEQARYDIQTWQSAGYELTPLPEEPLILNPVHSSAPGVSGYSQDIADMISQVDANTVYTLTGQLTGDWPANIGGAPYTFTTRHSGNSTAIGKATQFAYEYLQAQSLSTEYHSWSKCGLSNMRNVVGELPGNMLEDQIVLITAHIDDMPSSGLAPGADDNASGVVGVFTAADILSQYEFERTMRFVIFTGEEQGLCGSTTYADQAYLAGENIVAVLNLDMTAWDGENGPKVYLHTRIGSNPSYTRDLTIANAFIGVVEDYGLTGSLSPEVMADGENTSDHSPFWNKGFPGILAIEDDYDDFNPYYHTKNDKLTYLNQTYYVNFVRAAVGTAATLAIPQIKNKLYLYLPLVIVSASDK